MPIYPIGLTPYAVAAGDFNGDGKQDLAITAFGGNTFGLQLGTQTAVVTLAESHERVIPSPLPTSPTQETPTQLQTSLITIANTIAAKAVRASMKR